MMLMMLMLKNEAGGCISWSNSDMGENRGERGDMQQKLPSEDKKSLKQRSNLRR
jgi:hypothetical protein